MTRLLLMGLVMAIVGTAASYFQLSRFLRADLTASAQTQQAALASYVASDVDQYLSERLSFLQRLADSLPAELLTRPGPLHAWLLERSRLSPAFPLGLTVADTSGQRVGGEGALAADSAEFRGALAGRATFGKPMAIGLRTGLSVAVPVHNSAKQVIAVLVGTADLSSASLLDHLQRGNGEQAGDILLVSPHDRLIVASTDATLSLQPMPHDRAMDGFPGSGIFRNAQGIDEIASIASVPSTGWYVVARLPAEQALMPVTHMQSFILQRRAPAMVGVLVAIGFVVAWLLRPLLRAAEQAEKMAQGEADLAPLPVVRNDEIGHLTRAFNRLLSRLADNQAALQRLASHDHLTGLPNRQLLTDRLRQALAQAERHAMPVSVLYLDLDGFKQINDTLGHEAGDQALREIAYRLRGLVRPTDTVARIGGDEFVLLAVGFDAPVHCAAFRLAEQCIAAIAQPLSLGAADTAIGVSIGIAITHGRATPDQLLAAADKAMYVAKQNGRGRHAMAPLLG
ncbi:diguanylate cyclase domain-containing protein [Variovorax ginsengisoli]|uniref:Diguanylate cyclase (GGDEF)-like protein n=1 Tax=Variovorax ginsengisoli TaxID=363844 RepID=A0ABT9SAP2_9BURK|nr:diguanylate cyclase [Variovorax ginsengisoli]MDP9900826.1 diguanylate cyclase (GGDEF)-like protein [Variovorax ginsengisoli]